MNFYEYLYSFDYVIVPSTLRISVLQAKKNYPKSHLKVLTKNDLFAQMDFSWTPECEIFLYEEKKISWKFIPHLLSSMHFLQVADVISTKVKKLIELKKELLSRNLISHNPYFIHQLTNKKIAVLGYATHDRELQIFSTILHQDFTFLFLPNVQPKLEVKHFASIEDEVAYFYNFLGEQGIKTNADLKTIKLLKPPPEYEFWLKTLAHLYQVPVNIKSNDKLISLPLIKEFLRQLSQNGDINNCLLLLNEMPEVQKKLTTLINTYPSHRFKNYPAFLDTLLREIDVSQKIYQDGLEVINDFFDNQDKIYIFGFADSQYPQVVKDESYLNDEEKKQVGRLTSSEINEQERKFMIEKIGASSQIYFSYSDKTSSGPMYPSSIIDELHIKEINYPHPWQHYSLRWAKLYAGSLQDLFYKYGEADSSLPLYQSLLKEGQYRQYSNRLYCKKSLSITDQQIYSFSKLDSFFHCPFQYYLNYVLHLNEQEETFSIKLGQLIHSILEARVSDQNFDYAQTFQKYVLHGNFNAMESVYLERIKRELRFTIDFIERHENLINIEQTIVEHIFQIDLSANISLKGVADKIYQINSPHGPLYVVIDYKTGIARYHEKYLPYGLSLQLPLYALLLEKSIEFVKGQVIGLYIHPVLNSKITREAGLSESEFYQKQLQLEGVSINDKELLSLFDPTYQDSLFIRSLRTKKDGDFTLYAKVKSATGFRELAKLAEEKVLEADLRIRQFAFDISPIKIGSSVDACKYCPYRDICYRTNSDYQNIQLTRQSASPSDDDDEETEAEYGD